MDTVQTHIDFIMKERGSAIVEPPSELYDLLSSYTQKAFEIFPHLLTEPVRINESTGETVTPAAIYVFDDDEGPNDGEYYLRYRRGDELNRIALIGISRRALEAGRDQTVLTLLHELAHVLWRTDNPTLFHALLDSIIQAYNKLSGEEIRNDYVIPI